LNLAKLFKPNDPFRHEEYLLRSHANGVHLIGATPSAARLAVWDLLRRLGHRQFMPTDHWEVIPSEPNLTVKVDVIDKPDYVHRKIYAGGSRWSYAEPLWAKWRIRNRNESGASFKLSTGHIYGSIVRSNQQAFDENPEYFAMIDGERRNRGGNSKFCVSNDGLRKLVVDHNVRVIQANPDLLSVSMDPSDGGGWCECQACAKMGSVSDRVVILANEVAEAINSLGLGDKYVGIYAYAHHSPPPSVEVHPKVVVSIATAFIRGGRSVPHLVEQWGAKGAIIGLREYYSISTWHGDRPNRGRAASIPYLTGTVAGYHKHGARFNVANASHSWGGYGLGFYLLAQMLWDVDQADHIEELFDDFLERGFGPAREPIEKYYRLIYEFDSEKTRTPMSEHLIGVMYRHLARARELAGSDAADLLARINDLILYTRYVELYYQTESSDGKSRQKLGEELLRHIHATRRGLLVVSYRGDRRRLPRFDIPSGEALQAIQTIDAYTPEQIEEMLTQGVANNKLLDFEPVDFSNELVPASEALQFPDLPEGSFGSYAPRNRQIIYTWLDEPGTIALRVQGGMIAKYRNRGNVRITLHSPLDELGEGIAFDASTPPDGEEHVVKLKTPFTGLHWIEATDGDDATFVRLEDESLPYTASAEPGEPFPYRGRWTLYFYVPKGTGTVGGFAGSTTGTMLDSDGNQVFDFTQMEGAGYFKVDVPPGRDGTLWRIKSALGVRRLMTVPPYMAASPQHLLLPREVVEKDRP
jgi:hypothetical protein